MGAGSEELKAAIILFYSLLDERQRRLYAGLEAHKVVARGRSEDREVSGIGCAHGGAGAAGVVGERVWNGSEFGKRAEDARRRKKKA